MAKARGPNPVELELCSDAPTPAKTPQPDTKLAIKVYHDEHVKRHGIKPLIVGGKHAALFRTMISNWTWPVVEQLIRDFVWGDDPWAVRCGWTVEALYHVAPRMLIGKGQPDERTAGNIDAAKRSTQRRTS